MISVIINMEDEEDGIVMKLLVVLIVLIMVRRMYSLASDY